MECDRILVVSSEQKVQWYTANKVNYFVLWMAENIFVSSFCSNWSCLALIIFFLNQMVKNYYILKIICVTICVKLHELFRLIWLVDNDLLTKKWSDLYLLGQAWIPHGLSLDSRFHQRNFHQVQSTFELILLDHFCFWIRLQQQQNQKHNSTHPVNDHSRQHFVNEPSKMLNFNLSLNHSEFHKKIPLETYQLLTIGIYPTVNLPYYDHYPAESHVLYSKNASRLRIWGPNVPLGVLYNLVGHLSLLPSWNCLCSGSSLKRLIKYWSLQHRTAWSIFENISSPPFRSLSSFSRK